MENQLSQPTQDDCLMAAVRALLGKVFLYPVIGQPVQQYMAEA